MNQGRGGDRGPHQNPYQNPYQNPHQNPYQIPNRQPQPPQPQPPPQRMQHNYMQIPQPQQPWQLAWQPVNINQATVQGGWGGWGGWNQANQNANVNTMNKKEGQQRNDGRRRRGGRQGQGQKRNQQGGRNEQGKMMNFREWDKQQSQKASDVQSQRGQKAYRINDQFEDQQPRANQFKKDKGNPYKDNSSHHQSQYSDMRQLSDLNDNNSIHNLSLHTDSLYTRQRTQNQSLMGQSYFDIQNQPPSDDFDDQLNIQFEPSQYRPNERRSSKVISIKDDLGCEEERAVKRMLKAYWEGKGRKVTALEDIKAVINMPYPEIRLEYRINGRDKCEIDLIQFYRQDKNKDKFVHDIFRTLYNSNFLQIRPQQLKKLLKLIQYRSQCLSKSYVACLNGNQIAKSNIAVYSIIPNNTLQFCFVDFNYSEITFNSLFVESVKEKFAEAQAFCQKELGRLMRNQEGAGNEKVLVGEEEMSSDDDQGRKEQQKYDIEKEKQELQRFFEEDITSDFQTKIDDKDNKFNELRERGENYEEMLKLGDEVSELQSMLDSYEENRDRVKGEYVNLMHAGKMGGDSAEVDGKIHVLYKEFRMIRNQLLSQLPIIARKRELFQCLDRADLVILEGETGSGKSTQLPQMLCEYYRILRDPKAKPIALTQPRKLATRTLAERIAFEMGQKIDGFISYVASSGKTASKHSKIVVKLDRLLLDQIQSDPLLSNYSCLIIDQAHQRTISIDVIIGLIKNILAQRLNFKVIITSATLDSALFQKYFRVKTFKVSGRLYPVQTIYKPPPKGKQQSFADNIYQCIKDEILQNRTTMKDRFRGHVLTFCTTVAEIDQLCERIANYVDRNYFMVCPLHGKLLPEEQRKAFSESENKFKFIFATRIAETAVTIDKVKVVIDIGYDRETVYDQKKKISSFDVMPISVSAAKQRAGRAGRTSAGWCFRLYGKEFERDSMKANKTPEIQSTPLDIVVLRLKQLQIKDLVNFPYLSKPKQQNLKHSVQTMQLIGCLNQSYEITQIGRALVRIPIQPLLSRAIIDSLITDRLDRTRTITPKIIKILSLIVNSQSIFYSDQNTREICEKSKFRDFADQDGDFFSLLNVYEAFDDAISRKLSVHVFCKERFLNKKSLSQARELVKEITQIIQQTPLNLNRFQGYVEWMRRRLGRLRTEKEVILACLLSSFCQNLCLFSGQTMIGYTLVASKIPLKIYGSSFLSLQGINPKWIICHDIIHTSGTFCRVAQSVDFEMLRISLTQQVYRKYKLEQCQKFNPFYKVLDFDLPSVILKDFIQRKFNKDQRVADFIKDCECIYNSDTNTLKVFHLSDDSLELKIKDYLHLVQTQCSKPYHHNFLGTITATLGPGCQILKLHLSRQLFSVKIYELSMQWQEYLHEVYSPFCYSMDFELQAMTITFKGEEERKVFVEWVREVTKGEEKRPRVEVVTASKMRDNKLAKGCLKVKFWAAENQSQSKLLILYPKPNGFRQPDRPNPRPTQRQLNQTRQFLQDIHHACQSLQILSIQYGLTFKIARNNSSINVYLNRSQQITDQFELQTVINELYDNDPTIFKHHKVVGFREIDTTVSSVKEEEWQRKLQQLLPSTSLDAITVHGTNQDRAQKGVKEYLTDLMATINVVQSREAEEFMRKYDGKRGILGTEKVHATLTYKQNIMRVPVRIFEIFRGKYLVQKDILEKSTPGLEIFENTWRGRQGEDFIFLNCSHAKRAKLLLPTQQLRSIFTKFPVKVQAPVMKILTRHTGLNNRKIYNDLFDAVQCYFNWQIYCEIFSKKCQITIYCSSSIFKQVQKTLKQYLSQYNNIEVKVSYRGKNIYKVQEVLKRFEKEIQYEISYSERAVYLRGRAEVAGECYNEVNKLVDSQKAECEICFNVLSLPIKLFGCRHSYCNSCIVNYIRSVSEDSNSFPIKCPSQPCKKFISICDFRMLLDYEQFDRMCDKGVLKLVDDVKYHGCFTTNCQQIFEVQRTKAQKHVFSCGVCNLSYCFLCKQNEHLPYSCEEMKRIKKEGLTEEMMKTMGIKKCPQCKVGIEKNQGCNHISCKCGAHICWKCLRSFKDQHLCYDHLARECGGIF